MFKIQYRPISILFVLILGLISCNSDRNPESTGAPVDAPGGRIDGVQFIHEDFSTHDIQQIETLPVTSAIDFKNQEIPRDSLISEVHTQCSIGANMETDLHHWTIKGRNQIPVQDILPLQVFAPREGPPAEVLCDFQIAIKTSEQILAHVDLQEIGIQGLQHFATLSQPFSFNQGEEILLRSQLEPRIQSSDFLGLEVITLCETKSSHSPIQDSVPLNQNLFPDFLFHKNQAYCRLITIKDDQFIEGVTPAFRIQKSKPHLQTGGEFFLPGQINTQLGQSPLVRLWIQNLSEDSVDLNLSQLTTSIHIRPIYSQELGPLDLTRSRDHIFNARWQLRASNPPTLRASNTVTIAPGSRIELDLISSGQLRCRPGHNGPSTPQHCLAQYHFSGHLYKIVSLPRIQWDLWSHPNYENWQSLSWDLLRARYAEGFQVWSPNQQIQNICQGRQVLADINQGIRHLPHLEQDRGCTEEP